MAVLPVVAGLAAVFSALLYSSISGTNRYVPNACSNVAALLPATVVGQDMAVHHLVNAVCEHIHDAAAADGPATKSWIAAASEAALGGGAASAGSSAAAAPSLRRKPLVISVHGPPGTGKTFTHTLLATALYNRDPAAAGECPGEGCSGAKVLFGLSYVAEEQSGQLAKVREAVLEHLRSTPNPLLVIEEYDKLDCASRGMLRQLIRHPELANTDMSRAIILLESNLGFLELERLLTAVKGNKSQIPPEAAERVLRHSALTAWRAAECERIDDSLAFAATIDHYLPFFPLTRQDITVLLERELSSKYGKRVAARGGLLSWDAGVVQWLVGRVDFDGGSYPLEGASQVSSVCVRSVAHLFRELLDPRPSTAITAQQQQQQHHGGQQQGQMAGGQQGQQGRRKSPDGSTAAAPLAGVELRLMVAPGGRELQLLTMEREVPPGAT